MTDYLSTPTNHYNLTLGEGPTWNPLTHQVSVVDIFDNTVYTMSLSDTGLVDAGQFHTDSNVGAALPLSDGSMVTCERGGIFLNGLSGVREKVCELPVAGREFRANDAKIGPDGHLWVGVMDDDATEGRGSLWRIARNGHSQCLLEGLTIPNGMDWWGDEFWFVNGPTEVISCYRFDQTGLEGTPEIIATRGTPDGLVIDSDGTFWLALWGQGRVDHFDRHGQILDTVKVDSPHSTSLTFAGEDRHTLVITSARLGMSDEALAGFPHAGDIFTARVDSVGRQAHQEFR